MTEYTIRMRTIRTFRRPSPKLLPQSVSIPYWQVVDDTGSVRCNESTLERAKVHIVELQKAEQRRADAEREQERRSRNVSS